MNEHRHKIKKIKNPKNKYSFVIKKINNKEKTLKLIIDNYSDPRNKLIYESTKHLDYCFFTVDSSLNKQDRKNILENILNKIILTPDKEKIDFNEKEKIIMESRYIIKKLFRKNICYDFKNELLDFIYLIYEFHMNDFSNNALKYIDILTNFIDSYI